MRKYWCLFSILIAGFCYSAIVIPGADGSDGLLHVTQNMTIDLGEALTGTWDDSNATNAGKGVYDSEKWAVVFKYSSVTIDSGCTLKFINHPSNPPVMWLVNGDVTINGTIDIGGGDGHAATSDRFFSVSGPGGFRGGKVRISSREGSAGFGPGAGTYCEIGNYGAGGGYGSDGYGWSADKNRGGCTYGNEIVVPLIGGSGGAGSSKSGNYGAKESGGGAGGGALFVASYRLMLNGAIKADGGEAGDDDSYKSERTGGAGSGGAIRLVADEIIIAGSVNLSAIGGSSDLGGNGGIGRIRIEANTASLDDITGQPACSAGIPGNPVKLWPDAAHPVVKVQTLAEHDVPTNLVANLNFTSTDMVVNDTGVQTAIIETQNVPITATVKVFVVPLEGNLKEFVATHQGGNTALSTWTANLNLNEGVASIQARADF